MERCVIEQLMDHIHSNNLIEPLQSAYKSYHRTETALLKVKADILKVMDNQGFTCLVLLDLSAAFDAVDHKILLERLENYFGINSIALQWIELYLTNQSQRVVIGDMNTTGAKSESISLKFGVPQGSVLGPILFTLYTCPLGQVCANQVQYHLYADDQQIYLSFKPGPGRGTFSSGWMHLLDGEVYWRDQELDGQEYVEVEWWKKLSSSFLEHINNSKIDNITIKVGSKNIIPAEHVRNLGFFMDRFCKNTKHINHLTSLLCYQLRNIHNIRGKLDFNTAKTVVQTLIISKLDYCNSLLAGTPQCHLSQLQRAQNMACRVVCNLRKYDHVSASTYSLHWLQVRECITYKVAYLVNCSKMRLAP